MTCPLHLPPRATQPPRYDSPLSPTGVGFAGRPRRLHRDPNAARTARSLCLRGRTIVSPSAGCGRRPGLSFTCDVANATNAHQIQYRGVRDQMALDRNSGTAVTFSLTGRL